MTRLPSELMSVDPCTKENGLTGHFLVRSVGCTDAYPDPPECHFGTAPTAVSIEAGGEVVMLPRFEPRTALEAMQRSGDPVRYENADQDRDAQE